MKVNECFRAGVQIVVERASAKAREPISKLNSGSDAI